MLRLITILLYFAVGMPTIAQDVFKELPADLPCNELFSNAAQNRIEANTYLTRRGDIQVEIKLRKVRCRSSWATNLPNQETVADWVVSFVVVPKLDSREIEAIQKSIVIIPDTKQNVSLKASLTNSLPDFVSDRYGYRIITSGQIPVEDRDIAEIKSFIAAISKELHASTGGQSEKILGDMLLN
jgi:hypothetical protein